MKQRLDQYLAARGLVASRSQAESYIRLGQVKVGGQIVNKPGQLVGENDQIDVMAAEQYVSRAGLKLASVAKSLALDFKGKVLLDVGSSTGGFTDYALRHGARKVIAVDVGRDQLHPRLHGNPAIELREQTDIRDIHELSEPVDLVLIDVSFISLRDILPHVAGLAGDAPIVAMAKPQFEAGRAQTNKGIIKNERQRRDILKDFETWAVGRFVIRHKADSQVAGAKGNRERFYLLTAL